MTSLQWNRTCQLDPFCLRLYGSNGCSLKRIEPIQGVLGMCQRGLALVGITLSLLIGCVAIAGVTGVPCWRPADTACSADISHACGCVGGSGGRRFLSGRISGHFVIYHRATVVLCGNELRRRQPKCGCSSAGCHSFERAWVLERCAAITASCAQYDDGITFCLSGCALFHAHSLATSTGNGTGQGNAMLILLGTLVVAGPFRLPHGTKADPQDVL
jgi:hypothetical protein